jgi:hypothetical protein
MDEYTFSVIVLEILAFSMVVLEFSSLSSTVGEAATRYFISELCWKSQFAVISHIIWPIRPNYVRNDGAFVLGGNREAGGRDAIKHHPTQTPGWCLIGGTREMGG